MSYIYALTNTFETNNVANKGLMDIGGYAVPGVIMANNKVEARERAEKGALTFSFAFLAPLVCVPLLNKGFLKYYKVAKNFKNGEHNIMKLSKQYLSKDSSYMLEGIESLKKEAIKDNKPYLKGICNILENFKGKEDELKKLLIKTNHKVLFYDFIATGVMMGSTYWISNTITKLKTGRDGFSAEYKMAAKGHVEGKAKNYKENKKTNLLKSFGILLLGALATSFAFKKGMLSKNKNVIKKFSHLLDYKEGIFVSRSIMFLISLFGDIPSTLFASRDKEELKYNIAKNAVFYSVFFGGDLMLNNLFGRILDKTFKNVNLINKEKLTQQSSVWKKLTAPLYTMKELNNKTDWSQEVLNQTKKFKTAMFWGNFALVTAFLGFGTPHLLNKMVKRNVTKELAEKNQAQYSLYMNHISIHDFLKQVLK